MEHLQQQESDGQPPPWPDLSSDDDGQTQGRAKRRKQFQWNQHDDLVKLLQGFKGKVVNLRGLGGGDATLAAFKAYVAAENSRREAAGSLPIEVPDDLLARSFITKFQNVSPILPSTGEAASGGAERSVDVQQQADVEQQTELGQPGNQQQTSEASGARLGQQQQGARNERRGGRRGIIQAQPIGEGDAEEAEAEDIVKRLQALKEREKRRMDNHIKHADQNPGNQYILYIECPDGTTLFDSRCDANLLSCIIQPAPADPTMLQPPHLPQRPDLCPS